METEERKKNGIKIELCGTDNILIGNLQKEEIENLGGMIHNHFWVTVDKNGRLEAVCKREKIPDPMEDEEMLPFWRRPTPGFKQLQLFDVEIPQYSMPSIIIQHLCGYNYSSENYKIQAQILESYGFECLRSRRGEDQKYCELWFLPVLWLSKGRLKEVMENLNTRNEKEMLDRAINFLCMNVEFGTINVSFQKAAMTID